MTVAPKERRRAYRKQARADLCRPVFWLFAASLYGITFVAVALLMLVDRMIAVYAFHAPESTFALTLSIAFWWANLIEGCFLITITVLYVWGGLAWIHLRSVHKDSHDRDLLN